MLAASRAWALVQLWPVKAITSDGWPLDCALGGRSGQQAQILGEGRSNDAPVRETNRQLIVSDRHGTYTTVFSVSECRITHAGSKPVRVGFRMPPSSPEE